MKIDQNDDKGGESGGDVSQRRVSKEEGEKVASVYCLASSVCACPLPVCVYQGHTDTVGCSETSFPPLYNTQGRMIS